jgi:hypothetical protein
MKRRFETLFAAVLLGSTLSAPLPTSAEAKAKCGIPCTLTVRRPSIVPYAGDCGPNPPPGYRYDLKDWRSGFNRDFSFYMLDEN